ncbi:MAG TPA: hypothetical protein VIK61_04530 [Acidimicrobiia bacterium]
MNKVLATIAVGSLMAIAVPGVANAQGGGGVRVKGTCSAASTSKMKIKTDNAKIQTEFEVDENVVGDLWKVTISDNGTVVAKAKATTVAPSGSFTVRRKTADLPGTDMITASAKNTSTGETCSATASL